MCSVTGRWFEKVQYNDSHFLDLHHQILVEANH